MSWPPNTHQDVENAVTVLRGLVYNVRDYGATGDGVTDDTAAIQDAIAAADTANAALYFPPGTYKVTAPLSANPRRTPICGAGPQATRIVASDLAADAWLLTLGWDNAVPFGDRIGPYPALSGLTLVGPTSGTISNGVLLQGNGTSPAAYMQHFESVCLSGFGTQLSVATASYINAFHRCLFDSAVTRAFSIDQVIDAGENLSFVSCTFANAMGTLVYLDVSGCDAFFYGCSFDYSARALELRSGRASFTSCHFEANSSLATVATEYLLVNRRASVEQPILSLTDCTFIPDWDDYDTAIRLTGDTYGGNALRVTNPYVAPTTATMADFIRDDGPTASDITVAAPWYGDAAYVPLIRDNAGNVYRLTAGVTFVNRPERSTRRIDPTAIEPFPAVTARGLETPDSGVIYMTLFSPVEDVTLTGLAFWTGDTAQSGASLFRAALYEWEPGQTTLLASSANDTTLGGATFTRFAPSFTASYLCQAGHVYALALIVVGASTAPVLVSSGNAVDWLMKDSTYGHPVSLRVTGQTDLASPIFPGSLLGPDKTFYMVGIGS